MTDWKTALKYGSLVETTVKQQNPVALIQKKITIIRWKFLCKEIFVRDEDYWISSIHIITWQINLSAMFVMECIALKHFILYASSWEG